MHTPKAKKIILLLLKLIVLEESLSFIAAHYFFDISPYSISPIFVLSLLSLFVLNWYAKSFQKKDYFKPAHIPLIFFFLFLTTHFRAGIFWALNTFPLRDANIVLLTLQEPFDDFAYSMIKQYLNTTIPQALIISLSLTIFLYVLFNNTKKRLISIGAYFIATMILLFCDIPVLNYLHILNNEPEKNASYSNFFVENYVNPDSIKITVPTQKKNLILIYIESMETTFSDKEHGGFQESNLIPEITEFALQNISFGKNGYQIGGGLDASGSNATFASIHTRSLGIPNIINYKKTPILHHYKSLYKILNENGYKQIFFQGNSGLYNEFHDFVLEQKVDEAYGPEDLIQRLNLSKADLPNGRTVQDKDAFIFANQILDTIAEPFSLTFFTIDTHAPHGLYDPNCIKIPDEKNENDQLRASAQCVSRELKKFLTSLKEKAFYENTSIIVFGDHLFMGTRLVKESNDRKWVNILINASKTPVSEENRIFSDIDMFPTILSSINFNIEGDRLGFGTDLFSNKQTLVERIGLDSLNKEFNKMPGHLVYESYRFNKNN